MSDVRIYKSKYAPAAATIFIFGCVSFICLSVGMIRVFLDEGPGTAIFWIIVMAISIPLVIAAICASLFYFLRRIEVSEDGIMSKDWLGRKHVEASWDQLLDFYHAGLQGYTDYVVETTNGRVRFPYHFNGSEDFCDEVARRAINARVHKWLPIGARDFDLPMTFSYRERSKPLTFTLMVVLALVCVMIWGWWWFVPWRTQSFAWLDTLIAGLVTFVAWAGLPLVIGWWALTCLRLQQQHSEDEIKVDTKSLVLHSRSGKIELRWNEISKYTIVIGGFRRPLQAYVVQTKTSTIEFYPLLLHGWHKLVRIIPLKAANAQTKGWR